MVELPGDEADVWLGFFGGKESCFSRPGVFIKHKGMGYINPVGLNVW